MPDDLFAPLSQGPVPPLAAPATVRARGEQRRRRARAALTGTGAAALALAAVLGASLSGGQPDALQPADPLPAEQQPSERSPEQGLLTSEDVRSVLSGTWGVLQGDDLPLPVVPGGCADGLALGRPDAAPPGTTSVGTFFDGPGEAVVGQTVVEHPDAAAAGQALGGLVDAVEACDGQVPGWTVVGGLPGTSDDRAYGELVTADERLPYAVERVGPRLSAVMVRGATLEQMPALADAAAARLGRGPAVPEQPDRPEPYVLADAALTPEDLTPVEPGRWEYLDVVTDDGLLLDPCPGGTAYPRDVDRVARSSAGLLLLREAGGTDVVQQLARYSSVAAARDAFDGYRRAVEGCPSKPTEVAPEQVWRHEVVASTDEDDLRTVLVQGKTGCDESCAGGAFYLGFAYYAVQQQADAVVITRVAVGEDGDPGLDYAMPFFAVAEDRLRDTVG